MSRAVPIVLLAVLAAGCDTISPSRDAAVSFAERVTGSWALTVDGTSIAPSGTTAPLYGGSLVGGRVTISETNPDFGPDPRDFQLRPGDDWRRRGYDAAPTAGLIKSDVRVERIVFSGTVEDYAGTIEVDDDDRQVWAFYAPQADGSTERIAWTLTR